MHKFYARTPKAESEGAKLETDLKRMLTYMEGYLSSDELAKRAPPSLRARWKELHKQLLDGGYIVAIPEAKVDRRAAPREAPITVAATPAKDLHSHKKPAATAVEPEKAKHAEVAKSAASPPANQNPQPSRHDNSAASKNETRDTRAPSLPLPNPHPAGGGANESQREFHVKAAIKQQEEIPENVAQRIRNLEIENESLMKLLTDAYVEIEKLKAALGAKK